MPIHIIEDGRKMKNDEWKGKYPGLYKPMKFKIAGLKRKRKNRGEK